MCLPALGQVEVFRCAHLFMCVVRGEFSHRSFVFQMSAEPLVQEFGSLIGA